MNKEKFKEQNDQIISQLAVLYSFGALSCFLVLEIFNKYFSFCKHVIYHF